MDTPLARINGQVLIKLNLAEKALIEAKSIPEVKDIRDKAEAIRLYYKQRGSSLRSQNLAAELKLRAERKLGDLLGEMEKNKGTRGNIQEQVPGGNIVLPPDDTPTYSELGIGKMEASRWQLSASVPEEEFEGFLETNQRAGNELTTASVINLAKRIRVEAYRSKVATHGSSVQLPPGIVIEHGDFLQVMPKLIEDNSVDLVFTDPPYGEESLALWESLAKEAARALKPEGLLLAYSGQRFLDRVMFIVGKHLQFYWIIAVKHTHGQLRFWDRKVWNTWKPILIWAKETPEHQWFHDLLDSGAKDAKDLHDWGQPLSQAKEIIRNLCPEGGLVVDPMCGAGTIPLAASELGRRSIGIEIDENHYLTAKGRISDGEDNKVPREIQSIQPVDQQP